MRSIRTVTSEITQALAGRYDEGELCTMGRLVLMEVLSVSETDLLLLDKDTALTQEQTCKVERYLSRLSCGEPLQYVLGYTYFYGCRIKVGSGVLIPRPETEELVHLITQDFRGKTSHKSLRILDVGTGSACIPVALAHSLVSESIIGIHALEVSPSAIETARENIDRAIKDTGVEMDLIEGDLFRLEPMRQAPRYDIIVSNPPYIHPNEAVEMSSTVLDWEPSLALFAPPSNPVMYYEAIARLVSMGYLNHQGRIYLEVNPLYAERTLEAMVEIIGAPSILSAEVISDMSGKQRFVRIVRA